MPIEYTPPVQPDGDGGTWRLKTNAERGTWSMSNGQDEVLMQSAALFGTAVGAFAIRLAGTWRVLGPPTDAKSWNGKVTWQWYDPGVTATFDAGGEDLPARIDLHAPEAEATAISWLVEPEEHFYGLGERFGSLDQRGKLVDLWVRNGASGDDTYKPVPYLSSSKPYGVVVDTSLQTFVSLGHPITPNLGSVIVEGPVLKATIFTASDAAGVLERYTAWIGRPPIPPAWFFRPWKSRDWRVETQETVFDDIARHQEHDLPLGAKLIDATWETEEHTFAFDTGKYPDVAAMMRALANANVELVVWISPNITADTAIWEECRRAGYLITNAEGEPYIHRLGNQPGWEGSTFDFTNPDAVAWWQDRVRGLMELGVRGIKTDFGEQVPVDAHFFNGQTGRELHNKLPVLYNQATWAVVKEYDGVLLARSAWAGSQQYPAIWAGDQSADFSPWGGLPSAIVAGVSAGMSGFPYWGSDVGGYFNPPDDEVFSRWAQFGSVSPVMQVHGLGRREPWEFSPRTLDIYRAAAKLHDRLVPYALAASAEAAATGLPLMRAMPLVYPGQVDAHLDWVRFQYLYGPDLLAAPVYSWGTSRLLWFPPGEWVDFETGEIYQGPAVRRVPAPLEKLPLYARAGAVLPLSNPGFDGIVLTLFPGDRPTESSRTLDDGTTVRFSIDDVGEGRIDVAASARAIRFDVPHRAGREIELAMVLANGGPASRTFRWKQ